MFQNIYIIYLNDTEYWALLICNCWILQKLKGNLRKETFKSNTAVTVSYNQLYNQQCFINLLQHRSACSTLSFFMDVAELLQSSININVQYVNVTDGDLCPKL